MIEGDHGAYICQTTLEKAKDRKQHRSALADIVVELTDSGMDYYFLRPLKVGKVGNS